MIFINDLLHLLPEVYLVSGLLTILVYGSILEKNYNFNISLRYTYNISPLLILFLLVLLFFQPSSNVFYFNFLFENNHLSNFTKILISVLFFFLSFIFIDYYRNETQSLGETYEHFVLMLCSVLGMFFLASTNDFLILFLGIELLSLALYVLAASKKQMVSSLEAGLKYFVLGAFSSGIMLLGISLIYGSLGMTNFLDIKYFFIGLDALETKVWYIFLIGLVFVTGSLFFKLPAAPFHSWAPDVYTGAPTFITAFFSIVPKAAILSVVIKLFYNILFDLNYYWSFFLIFCSISSLVIGCLGAIYNNDLKRLMAYGTINHLGFILLGLSTVSVEGLQSGLFYLTVYLVLSLNFFSILLSLRYRDNKKRVLFKIRNFSSLLYASPLMAVFLILNLFSMAGIPPLAGFFSKFYVLYAALDNGMFLAALVAVSVSSASCFYYIRMIKSSMFESEQQFTSKRMIFNPISLETSSVIVASALFNLLFFVNPNFLLSTCYNISYKLFL